MSFHQIQVIFQRRNAQKIAQSILFSKMFKRLERWWFIHGKGTSLSTKCVSAVIEQRLKNKVDKYISTVNLKGKKSVFQNMEMNLSILFYGGSVGAAQLTSLDPS